MIYVLSTNRIDTMRWAKAQGIPLLRVRHVQNASSLPGVINPKTTRMVQLPSYAKRRDTFAIRARLKQITRRARIEIEEWTQDDEGNFVPPTVAPEVPLAELYAQAEAEGAEIVLPEPELSDEMEATFAEAESDTPSTKIVLKADVENFLEVVGKAHAEASALAPEGGAPAGPVEPEERPASYAEGEGAKASVAGGLAFPAATKRDAEITEVQNVVEQTRDDLTNVGDALGELVEAKESEEPAPEAKPKRTRRTKVQMAYDEALVNWESNGGSVEAVQEARKALKEGDPRLAEDPTDPDDLDF